MYKTQMKFQRFVCYLAVISGVILFLYALGLMTDLYDSLYSAMRNPNNPHSTKVEGSWIYYDMQPFNKALLYLSIGVIILTAFLFLTQTHARRKYYAGNLLCTGLFTAAAAGVCVYTHINADNFKAQYLTTVDFEALLEYAAKKKYYYTDSTFWFDSHYAVCAILLAAAVLLLINYIWKKRLMREEDSLLCAGKKEAVL